MISLEQLTRESPYVAYSYSYPHKTAYRPLDPPRPLDEVWDGEAKDALFLYLHVPFCEMRCGFCNLFTTANPPERLAREYVAALWREARRVRDGLGPARFARMAIGGGTPTYLAAEQLDQLFQVARELFGVDAHRVPASVETSPRTAEPDKLRVLKDHGVGRISIGVQSFVEAEVRASGRAQTNAWVDAAIGRIRDMGFPVLNLDLIYGLPGQTVGSWAESLRAALRWRPEELYLYPLYVRPLTGLERCGRQAEDELRLACYRHGRDLLLEQGYEQVSMRMFRLRRGANADIGPVYCCQEDGMLGLGCGARSYTRALHYSGEYAVGAGGVREIIDGYVGRDEGEFGVVDYGCELDEEEQRRRWMIKSLLRIEGADLAGYRRRFGTDALDDLPELAALGEAGLIEAAGERLRPTPLGLERSDAVGPWLYSAAVRRSMDDYELR